MKQQTLAPPSYGARAPVGTPCDWSEAGYNPTFYELPCFTGERPVWADPPVVPKVELDERGTYVNMKLTPLKDSGYAYDASRNAYLNPKGKTGIQGRGMLGKFGPNHAADVIVTRYHDGKYQALLVEKKLEGGATAFAWPAGMVEAGESVPLTHESWHFDALQVRPYDNISKDVTCRTKRVEAIGETLSIQFEEEGGCNLGIDPNEKVILQLANERHPKLSTHLIDEYVDYLETRIVDTGTSSRARNLRERKDYSTYERNLDYVSYFSAEESFCCKDTALFIGSGREYGPRCTDQTGGKKYPCRHKEMTIRTNSFGNGYVECPDGWRAGMLRHDVYGADIPGFDGTDKLCVCTHHFYSMVFYHKNINAYPALFANAQGCVLEGQISPPPPSPLAPPN